MPFMFMMLMTMLWSWPASDARPFRALYSGSGRLNLEFDVCYQTHYLGLGAAGGQTAVQRAIPRMCERLTGPCFTGTGPRNFRVVGLRSRYFISKIHGCLVS